MNEDMNDFNKDYMDMAARLSFENIDRGEAPSEQLSYATAR